MSFGVLVKVIKHPSILAMAKQIGYDFVLFDNEHGGFTFQELHDLCMYANAIGLKPIVRLSEISKTDICKTLDAGAKGLLVPMVEIKEQVDRICEMAYYPPLGIRGYAGGANTNYVKGPSHSEFIEMANSSVEVYVQIETKEAVKNAKAILSNPLLTGVVIGPADLAISLGHPGDFTAPDEMEAMRDVADLCKEEGKIFGIIAGKKVQEPFAKDTGFVVTAIDTDLIYQGLRTHYEDRCK